MMVEGGDRGGTWKVLGSIKYYWLYGDSAPEKENR